jgi:hypothetical protein
VGAWWNDRLQTDGSVGRQPAQLDESRVIYRILKPLGPHGRIGSIKVMRKGFRLATKYQASFREQLAGGRDGFRAIAVDVGASELVTQEQSYVLRRTIEVLRRYINRYFQPFPSVENRPFGSMWNRHRSEAPSYPCHRGKERRSVRVGNRLW